jgi:hypothetical protein
MGSDSNHRAKAKGRFVRLDHSLLSSPAYRAATPKARALLIELAMMENSRNNGTLFLSVRDAADRMGVADLHAARAAIDELIGLGFIEITREAHFAIKAGDGSRARGWRLTWLPVPSESKGPTHDYQRYQARDKQAYRRLSRGRMVLDRFTKKQMPVVESTTGNTDRVWKSTTTIGNTPPESGPVVVETTTLNGSTPHVSVDPRCSGNHPIYSSPASGPSDPEADRRKHAENSGRPFRDLIDGETLDHLRDRLKCVLEAAPVGSQSRIAESAGIPKGTLSKFRDGRGLPACHATSLSETLDLIEPSRAA